MTIEQLATHARTIGYAFKIEIVERDIPYELSHSNTGIALSAKGKPQITNIVSRAIYVRYMHTEYGYAIAMHELGHALHPNGCLHVRDENNPRFGLILLEEEAAYEWAHANSPIWTPEMQRAEEVGMMSYREGAAIQKLKERVAARRHAPPHRAEKMSDFLKRSGL